MKAVTIPPEGRVHAHDRGEQKIRKDLRGQISHVLISSTYLQERIRSLAKDIIRDFSDKKTGALQIVVVLKGATTFANMLAQEIFKSGGPSVRFNYIKASSYGNDIASSGHVRISGQLPYVRGKDILIVEDIIDTGQTLDRLKEYLLEERGASSVKICALLDKRARRRPELRRKLHVDYTGFKVPDMFIAGYGIDCAEHFRELPYIVAVNERYFAKGRGKKKEG
ncbi:MAG: hypoxanthine phosphoribosyltransferase [Candidatus Omnitrophota bacterium]